MAVGLPEKPVLLSVNGVRLAACSAGLYRKERPDLALIACDSGAIASAVFTRNAFCAAPVRVARQHIRKSPIRYCVVNAGNANAGLGERGYDDSMAICRRLSQLAACPMEAILPFSTGVIGEPLPVDKICDALPRLLDALSENAWLEAARAMMTTDTVPKGISRQCRIGGRQITITGIAKGSGMINPDMATMLAFIATDADVDRTVLDHVLCRAIDRSFNRISVDGDTSTNDACTLIATGKSRAPRIDSAAGREVGEFYEALEEVCVSLAQAIVRDGEGATKFVTIDVRGGLSQTECRSIATAIAHSPLVKTALFASDPNWGRILAAVGRSGVTDLDVSKVAIAINGVGIVENGGRSPSYTESRGKEALNGEEITLRIDLNRGNESLLFWTCDLSLDYVRINAEYRT